MEKHGEIMKQKNNKHLLHRYSRAQLGFSLIELIVVIAIMAVLIGVLAPSFVGMADKNRRKACFSNRETVLDIYARCAFDSSIEDIQVDDNGIHKATGLALASGAKSAEAPAGMVLGEMKEVLKCPKHGDGNPSWTVTVDTATSTAYVECADCGDTASLDMMGWTRKPVNKGIDDPYTEPTETESETQSMEELVTVKFNLMGHGSPKPADQKVVVGEKATEPTAPTAATYKFEGWYTESECFNMWSFSSPVTQDMTLYAKWGKVNEGLIWPYTDDPSWWDPNDPDFAKHKDELGPGTETGLKKDENNKTIQLRVPTAIFTGKTGAQFVVVAKNDAPYKDPVGRPYGYMEIWYKAASSPEYYCAFGGNGGSNVEAIIQLTGNRTTVDITSMKETDTFVEPDVNYGDIIEYVDGDKSYQYVKINYGKDTVNVKAGDVRHYANQINNTRRIGP